jgi:hypothetical protein
VDTQGITVEVSKDQRLIFVKLRGMPKPEAIVRMLEGLNTLIETDVSLRVLIDEDDLRPGFVGPGDIARFVQTWRQGTALRKARLAVFVSNPAMYGLNRMFQGIADAEGLVRVFHDRAHAVEWLDSAATDKA